MANRRSSAICARFRLSEGFFIFSVGQVQHFSIAAAVAVGRQVTGMARREQGFQSFCFLWSVTVFTAQSAGNDSVFYFYSGSQYFYLIEVQLAEEGLDPVIDAGTDHEYSGVVLPCERVEQFDGLLAHQVAVALGKLFAEMVEAGCGGSAEKVFEQLLFGAAVGVGV